MLVQGTHCIAIPEPPDVTDLMYLPSESTEYLSVVSRSSKYLPDLPKTIRSHPDFGLGKEFLIDGFINDVVGAINKPNIIFMDQYQSAIRRLTFDVSFASLSVESDLAVSLILNP